jgi:uncharacterized protein
MDSPTQPQVNDSSLHHQELPHESSAVPLVPTRLVIIQPTPFCNIDCSYCYLAGRSNKKRMSVSTLQAIARFLANVPSAEETLTICWHAGEPLVLPPSFYDEAFTILASGRKRVHQNIQTNGTLINDEWCRLFKKWRVQIGLSIDGPKAVHDRHRVDRSGHGTFDRVMRGISKLREHKVHYSALAVVTRDSLTAADELWSFFKSAGLRHVGFNIDEAEGVHRASSLENEEQLRAFRAFLSRIADLHDADKALQCREVEDMRRHLESPPGAGVERGDNQPGAILNINVDGDVTTFSPELLGQNHPRYGTFAWGNVHAQTWAQIAEHPGFQRACADIAAGVELCRRSCQYFSVCGGGCPSNKLAELGTFAATETQCCRFHVQAVADVMIERMERDMESGLRQTAAH